MMTEPNYIKCPICGAPLKKVEMFKENVTQCTKCEYKYVPTLDESGFIDNILEESG